ncbi:hypothetical protein Pmar_PMAR017611 [Perkinsus marinus ATCC 50983]|uniref:Uncharacterized protein n=1 Tax=Perkinsus marinus (strain ATCC 50983 / TXsc) TaxID=423536 RepID=C5L3H9_PERM5|nr:hypothetical protein Pmar_PMAR017611 [Perkinsus marinus ATCC 50983]EER08558.1 hypothetical protein Pmar_PMAR017611 [Perkinsus marinus ATCC 50983]|eukprot:XP_002776742.1 hypothetical protein Pmar_PMAR017611 [Perkinsus marinus ATCC 50983]
MGCGQSSRKHTTTTTTRRDPKSGVIELNEGGPSNGGKVEVSKDTLGTTYQRAAVDGQASRSTPGNRRLSVGSRRVIDPNTKCATGRKKDDEVGPVDLSRIAPKTPVYVDSDGDIAHGFMTEDPHTGTMQDDGERVALS